MDRLKILFDKYNNKQSSPEEEQELLDLFVVENNESLLKDYIYQAHREDFEESGKLDLAVEEVYQKLHQQIFEPQQVRVKKLRPLKWLAAAAAVATIVFGLWFFNYRPDVVSVPGQKEFAKNDIAPGKQGATLTLSNGKKIKLSDAVNGELAQEAGVVITKSANGEVVYEFKKSGLDEDRINTLSTERGETYILTLPDRSKVWLNAASSLTYRASLNERGRRVVKLSGEGYFEIAKDKKHPFIVETAGQQIEVLGTHFNVNSYADEPVKKTTLIEGSVKLLVQGGQSALLKPDQQATLRNGQVKVITVDTELFLAWKNNNFVFENDDIQYIMRQVERWYNVEVIYQDTPTEKFWGSVSKFDNISSVLNILESAGGVHFRLSGRKLYVSK